MSETSYNFERCLVHLIVEKMTEKGLKHQPTAAKAWPNTASADSSWRAVRNVKPDKLPQRITIGDAVALCEVIEESFPELVMETKIRVAAGWNHRDHDIPKGDKK